MSDTPAPVLPRLLTAREVAELLGVSERTIWAISTPRGSLRAVRIGKLVRFDPADALAFIESSKGATA
jgi:excisionase family DNA binding protein